MILDCDNENCVHCKEGETFYCELGHDEQTCDPMDCSDYQDFTKKDMVNSPPHYVGKIEVIDYLRDKLTPAEFTGFCMGNVLKYSSRWRKKDGLQDLKKAQVYLKWAIENEEKHT